MAPVEGALTEPRHAATRTLHRRRLAPRGCRHKARDQGSRDPGRRGIDGARRPARRRRRRERGAPRLSALGRGSPRRTCARPAPGRRADRKSSSRHRRPPDARTGQTDSRLRKGNPVRRRGDSLLRRGRSPHRRIVARLLAKRHSQPRRVLASRRRRRDHAVELSGGHLRVEGRPGVGGRLHPGDEAAARDAARDRARRTMFRRRGPSTGGPE